MTFEQLDEVLIPRLGTGYRNLLFNEAVIAYNGIQKEKQQDYEFLNKVVHNAARFQSFFTVRSNPYVKHPPKKFEDIFTFAWEENKNQNKPTDQQWEEWNKRFPKEL